MATAEQRAALACAKLQPRPKLNLHNSDISFLSWSHGFKSTNCSGWEWLSCCFYSFACSWALTQHVLMHKLTIQAAVMPLAWGGADERKTFKLHIVALNKNTFYWAPPVKFLCCRSFGKLIEKKWEKTIRLAETKFTTVNVSKRQLVSRNGSFHQMKIPDSNSIGWKRERNGVGLCFSIWSMQCNWRKEK